MMNTQIQQYLPQYVNLYFVDYNNSLCNHKNLIQNSLSANSLQPIYEEVLDWWDYPEGEYLEDIRQKMEQGGAEELYEENEDEICDWLHEKDTSNPVENLVRNTGEISMFYSLGLEIYRCNSDFMCNPCRDVPYSQDAYKIRQKLGIKKGTQEALKIDSIVHNSYYGGELRLYFRKKLTTVLSSDPKNDFKQIKFSGEVAVAIYNSCEGAGDYEYIQIDKTFPFIRENLYISESDKYSLERCFGLYSDWLKESKYPILSMDKLRKGQAIVKSKNATRIIQEAELDMVFKAGGCSVGDMDIARHRDVYYDNNVPCGSHCPHCGTFWID